MVDGGLGMTRKSRWQVWTAVLLIAFCVTAIAWADQFVGSKNSTKYHYSSCKWANKIKSGNLVVFSSAADARAKGYQPCKVCKPLAD
jgi:hypothetical protein